MNGHFFNNNFDEFEMEDDGMEEEIRAVELNLVATNLNRRIIINAIKMLESSWWWKFTRYKTKLKMISECYKTFSKLVSEPEEE